MKQALIALDQLVNTWFFWWLPGGTWADETLSARAWRLRKEHPKLYVWIDRLFFWDKDHCKECYEIERRHLQLPLEYQ